MKSGPTLNAATFDSAAMIPVAIVVLPAPLLVPAMTIRGITTRFLAAP